MKRYHVRIKIKLLYIHYNYYSKVMIVKYNFSLIRCLCYNEVNYLLVWTEFINNNHDFSCIFKVKVA